MIAKTFLLTFRTIDPSSECWKPKMIYYFPVRLERLCSGLLCRYSEFVFPRIFTLHFVFLRGRSFSVVGVMV